MRNPRWSLWIAGICLACGGVPPPAGFTSPAGPPEVQRAACEARLRSVPTDPVALQGLRRAARALGASDEAASWLRALAPAPRPVVIEAAIARAELEGDPAQGMRTATGCLPAPECALALALAEGRAGSQAAAYARLVPLAAGVDAVAAEAAAALASLSLAEGRAEGPEWLARAQVLDPSGAGALRAAALAAALGDDPQVPEALERARVADGSHPELATLEALWAERSGRAEEALAAWGRALQRAPGLRAARLALVARLQTRGAHQAALDHLAVLAAQAPEDRGVMVSMARSLLKVGAPQRALAWADRALAAQGTDLEAGLLRAEALIASGAVAQAQAEWGPWRALAVDAGPGLQLAAALEQAGQRAAAEAELAAVVTRFPTDPAGWLAYAQLHGRRGRPAHAVTVLTRGLALCPEAAPLHAELSAMRERLEDLPGARQAMARAARLAPEGVEYADELARLRFLGGDPPAGIAAWEAALARHPEAERVMLRLSHAYRAVGREPEALRLLERLVARQPQTFEVLGHLGDTLMDLKRPAEAAPVYRRALAVQPEARMQARLAEALFASGEPAAAWQALDVALAADPGDQRLWLRAAQARLDAGELEAALAVYGQVLARWPEQPQARAALDAMGRSAAPGWSAVARDPELARLAREVPPGTATRAATVLRDEREVEVDERGLARVRHRRSVLLHQAAAQARYAEAQIAFHAAHAPQIVRARTLTPDGQVHPVGADGQIVRNPHAGTPLFGDGRSLVLRFPQLQPGAVIDYEVVVERPQPDLEGAWWDGYILANVEPTVQARYSLELPEAGPLAVHAPGLGAPQRLRLPGGRLRLVWVAEGLLPQELVATRVGEVPSVYASSFRDWKAVDAWYHGLFAPRSRPGPAVRARAQALAADARSPRAQVAAVYASVEQEIRYLGLEFGIGAFRPREAADTLASKQGDCKDMTALMVALLAALGVEAHPALVRPRSQGAFIADHPSPGQFSHVVLYVPSLKLWLDATAGLGTLDAVPEVLRGQTALVVDGRGGRRLTVPAGGAHEAQRHRLTQALDYALDLTGGGDLRAEVVLTGDLAGSARQKLAPLAPEARAALLGAPGHLAGGGVALEQVTVEGLETPAAPLVLQGSVRHPDLVGLRLDGALVLGQDLGFLTEGPLAAFAARSLPEGPRLLERVLRLRPPAGYRFGWSPLRFSRSEGPIRFELSEARRGDETVITSRMRFDRGRLGGADQAALRGVLRAAHEALERPLELLPPADFDRVAFLRAAAADQPDNGELQVLAGEALLQAGDAALALGPLERAAALGVDEARLLALLAAARYRAGDRAAAIATLETLSGRPDALPAAHLMLAALLTDTSDHAGAVLALRRAVARHPEDLRSHQRLVAALGRSGDGAGALRAAEALAAAHPGRPEAWMLLGDVAQDQAAPARAVEAYRAALALSPEDPRLLNNLAWLLRQAPADRAEGLRLAERAVKLDPEADSAWDTLGVLRALTGDRAGAEAALREALRHAPPGRRALYEGRLSGWAQEAQTPAP